MKAVLHNLLGSTHVGSVDTGMGQKSLKPRGPKAACERWGGGGSCVRLASLARWRYYDSQTGAAAQKGIRPVAEAHVTGKLRALRCGLHNRRGPHGCLGGALRRGLHDRRGPHGCLGGAAELAGPPASDHDDGRRIPSADRTAAIKALPLVAAYGRVFRIAPDHVIFARRDFEWCPAHSGVVRDCNSGWDQVGCRAPGAWTRAWLWCWCDLATWATLHVHQCLQRTRALIGCCRALMASCDGGSGVYLNDG